jgi:tRNA pseudouridine-54 N-methylase
MTMYFMLFGGFSLCCAALFAYNHRNDAWIDGLLRPDAPSKEIKFDSGSVRALSRDAESAQKITSAEDALAPGAMRRCVRKQEILYTDNAYPAGMTFAIVQGLCV